MTIVATNKKNDDLFFLLSFPVLGTPTHQNSSHYTQRTPLQYQAFLLLPCTGITHIDRNVRYRSESAHTYCVFDRPQPDQILLDTIIGPMQHKNRSQSTQPWCKSSSLPHSFSILSIMLSCPMQPTIHTRSRTERVGQRLWSRWCQYRHRGNGCNPKTKSKSSVDELSPLVGQNIFATPQLTGLMPMTVLSCGACDGLFIMGYVITGKRRS